MRWTMVVLLTLLLPSLTDASKIEDAAAGPCATVLWDPLMQDEFCKYQYDAGEYGDAADRCADVDRGFRTNGPRIQGTFVPLDDTYDYYELEVYFNRSVRVTLTPNNPLDDNTWEVQVFSKDCGSLLTSGIGYNGNPAIADRVLTTGTYIVGASVTYPVPSDIATDDGPIAVLDHIAVQTPILESDPVAVVGGSIADQIIRTYIGGGDTGGGDLTVAIDYPMQCHPFCPAQDADRVAYPRVGYKMRAQTY